MQIYTWQSYENIRISDYYSDGNMRSINFKLYPRVQLRSVFFENLIFPIINLCKLTFVNKTNSDRSQDMRSAVGMGEHF